jgi:hypothetical protein
MSSAISPLDRGKEGHPLNSLLPARGKAKHLRALNIARRHPRAWNHHHQEVKFWYFATQEGAKMGLSGMMMQP